MEHTQENAHKLETLAKLNGAKLNFYCFGRYVIQFTNSTKRNLPAVLKKIENQGLEITLVTRRAIYFSF